ncbi:MAG: sn-glycerol-3-phosphate ABC transporter substrate-binding protein UgpB [Thalassobaculales bacterium]
MKLSLSVLAASASLMALAGAAQAQIEIQWWHAMTGVNNQRIDQIAADFNKSQSAYKVVPAYKGSYAETMQAGIAAFRAGNAPHIMQVFEVGTATMMGAKGAVKPVHELMAEAGESFDSNAYLPAITGYYSTVDGKMLSMPFNSSSAITFWNKDLFKKAGLDPEKGPATWPEYFAAAKKVREAGAACGFTAGWITWTQLEQFSAWHNVPLATKANGLDGFDAELRINSPLHVRHVEALANAQKDKTFDYSGRTTQPEGRFVAGDCGMIQTSSAFYGNLKANAKFEFGMMPLPYYPDVAGAPQNSIIGGASLWVMGGKKAEEYKGVAKFFTFLSDTDLQVDLHTVTGYLPITKAAYAKTRASGFYEKNPGRDVPLRQLDNKPPTENSRGLRLGNLVQIRDMWAEELEAAFSGQKSAKAALDAAVERGNQVLRAFERTVSR